MITTCTATKKDGTPCVLPALPSTDVCFAHSPQAAEARAAGGRGTASTERAFKMLPAKLKPLFYDLKDLYRDCRNGDVSPEIARACAAVARVMVVVLERGQLEEEIQAIERAANTAAAETNLTVVK